MSDRPSTFAQDVANEAAARPRSRQVGALRALLPFLKPYRLRVLCAVLALFASTLATLMLPLAVRSMIDSSRPARIAADDPATAAWRSA